MPLTPKNRKEEWLQGLVDHETTLTPKNRPEEWMKEIIDASGSGGGGGTGGGVLVCTLDSQTGALDKTWKEIHDAPFAVVRNPESLYAASIGHIYYTSKAPDTGECTLMVADGSAESETITWYNTVYVANTENDYPVIHNS